MNTSLSRLSSLSPNANGNLSKLLDVTPKSIIYKKLDILQNVDMNGTLKIENLNNTFLNGSMTSKVKDGYNINMNNNNNNRYNFQTDNLNTSGNNTFINNNNYNYNNAVNISNNNYLNNNNSSVNLNNCTANTININNIVNAQN